MGGIDGLAAAMLVALVVATPLGGWAAIPAFAAPLALLAGIGVGITSSVIPYVCDQLAMARMPRATYALLVSLLPATATVIGIVVLAQIPTLAGDRRRRARGRWASRSTASWLSRLRQARLDREARRVERRLVGGLEDDLDLGPAGVEPRVAPDADGRMLRGRRASSATSWPSVARTVRRRERSACPGTARRPRRTSRASRSAAPGST